MNNLLKYLVLSTLVLVMMSSASAMINDLNAWDANVRSGVRHANRGEDFNVIISDGALRADVNTDFNYLVALSYTDSRGLMYLDLNINVFSGASAVDANGDGNVTTKTLSGALGTPCYSGGDWNVLALKDSNVFTLNLTVPNTGTDINKFVGKPVLVELWAITGITGTGPTSATCVRKVADGNFIIGPAIIVKTPNISDMVAKKDQNILVMGFGFTPSNTASATKDKNVTIYIWDANGTAMSAINRPNDMNVRKGTGLDPLIGRFHIARADKDTNGTVLDLTSNVVTTWAGITVYPDLNGEFDLNLTIPYVSNSAGSTIGRSDLNTLRAYSISTGDVNAVFIVAPKITTAADMNVTVTVSSHTYSVEDAMFQRLITDFNNVSNFIVRMGTIIPSIIDPARRQVEILFNGNVNLKATPVANYSTDMIDGNGYASIDSTKLPEFAIDANVNMYKIKVGSGDMPNIIKDSKACSSSVCTNQDGTVLSSEKAWSYDAVLGDGNLSFRVTTFSSYEASPFSLEVQTPNGGEKIRAPRHGADANYTIQFRFKDQNTTDNNTAALPLRSLIYYSTTSGAKTGVIINDTNLFDTIGIRCNGWSNLTPDVNLNRAEWITCVYDMNRADLNKLVGEYLIDVNVSSHAGRIPEQSMLDSTDQNVFFNPPLIEITDVNLNAVSHFQINAHSNAVKYSEGALDINYVIDFNMYLPDWNSEQKFTLGDYHIHFYLSGISGALTNDLNISTTNFDQNFKAVADQNVWIASGLPANQAPFKMECLAPPVTAPFLDFDCNAQFDTNNVIEGMFYLDVKIKNNKTRTVFNRNQGSVSVEKTLDVNELWDINSSTLNFTVNDNNAPRARFGTGYGSVERTVLENTYNLVLYCDDNTSGPYQYMFKESGTSTWTNNGTNTLHLSVPTAEETKRTFSGGCLDYAGNISDINSTIIITFRPPGTTEHNQGAPSSDGPGSPPAPVEEGTETIVLVETQGTPTELTVESMLTEAGFTAQEIATAMQFATSTAIVQRVGVDKITTATGSTYSTLVSIKVTNNSSEKWENVRVVAEIPKALAANASHVKSSFAMKVLKADPIIEFTVPEIQVGETVNVIYSVAKNISDITAKAIPIGMVTAYDKVAPCENVVCDSDKCTIGTCNSITGECDYANRTDGTACATGKECKAGTCIEKVVPPEAPAPPAPDYTMPIVAIVIVIIVIAGAAMYLKKGKRGKRLGK